MNKPTYFLALASLLLITYGLHAQDCVTEPAVDKYGSAIILERNSTNGVIERISNLALNISQYGYELSSLNADQVKTLTTQVITDYGDFLGLASTDLSRGRVVQRDGRWHVYARQEYRGVPVLGTDFGFSIGTRGRITSLRTRVFPKISLASVTPTIDAQTASTIALAAFEREVGASDGRVKNNVYLAVRPHVDDKAGASDLVWVVDVVSSSPWLHWEFWVDA